MICYTNPVKNILLSTACTRPNCIGFFCFLAINTTILAQGIY